mmetsp:Transcript_4545/g.12185  ORF Transcript_4545/g.12185 Transcript_4545/m.12185 type:complete len:93 (+) Transcript_4545:601-879(+)
MWMTTVRRRPLAAWRPRLGLRLPPLRLRPRLSPSSLRLRSRLRLRPLLQPLLRSLLLRGDGVRFAPGLRVGLGSSSPCENLQRSPRSQRPRL